MQNRTVQQEKVSIVKVGEEPSHMIRFSHRERGIFKLVAVTEEELGDLIAQQLTV